MNANTAAPAEPSAPVANTPLIATTDATSASTAPASTGVLLEGPAIEPQPPPAPPQRHYVPTIGPAPVFQPYLSEGDLVYQLEGGLSISRVGNAEAELVSLFPVQASPIGMVKEGDEIRVLFGSTERFPNADTLDPPDPDLSARWMRFDVADADNVVLLEDRWLKGPIDGVRVLGDRVYALSHDTGLVGLTYSLDSFELLGEKSLNTTDFVLGLGPNFLALHDLTGNAPAIGSTITIIGFDDGEWNVRGQVATEGRRVGNPHYQDGVLYVPTDVGLLNPINVADGTLQDQEEAPDLFLADVAFDGPRAYVSTFGGSHHLSVFDLANGSALRVYDLEIEPRLTFLTLAGGRLFGFGHDAGIDQRQAASFSLSDPDAPTLETILSLEHEPPTNGITERPWGPMTLVDEVAGRLGLLLEGGSAGRECPPYDEPDTDYAGVQWFSVDGGFSATDFVELSEIAPGSLQLIQGQPFNLTGGLPEPATVSSPGPPFHDGDWNPYCYATEQHTLCIMGGHVEVASPEQTTNFEVIGEIDLPPGTICGLELTQRHWARQGDRVTFAYLDEVNYFAVMLHFDVGASLPTLSSVQRIPLSNRIAALTLTPTHLVIDMLQSADEVQTLMVHAIDENLIGDAMAIEGEQVLQTGHGGAVPVLTGTTLAVHSDFATAPVMIELPSVVEPPLRVRADRVLSRDGAGLSWRGPGSADPIWFTDLTSYPWDFAVPLDHDRVAVVQPMAKPETQTWHDSYKLQVITGLLDDTPELSTELVVTHHAAERAVAFGGMLVLPGLSDGALVANYDGTEWRQGRLSSGGVSCNSLVAAGERLLCNHGLGVTFSVADVEAALQP